MEDETIIAQTTDVDYRTLEVLPSPEEFFLLSRLKGEVSVGHLCRASGLEKSEAKRIITKLIDLGLIHVTEEDVFFEVFDNRQRKKQSESGVRPNFSEGEPWNDLRETLELDALFYEDVRDRIRAESEITKPTPAQFSPIGEEIWGLNDSSSQTTVDEISLNTVDEISLNTGELSDLF